jgi:hypothetical protein
LTKDESNAGQLQPVKSRQSDYPTVTDSTNYLDSELREELYYSIGIHPENSNQFEHSIHLHQIYRVVHTILWQEEHIIASNARKWKKERNTILS